MLICFYHCSIILPVCMIFQTRCPTIRINVHSFTIASIHLSNRTNECWAKPNSITQTGNVHIETRKIFPRKRNSQQHFRYKVFLVVTVSNQIRSNNQFTNRILFHILSIRNSISVWRTRPKTSIFPHIFQCCRKNYTAQWLSASFLVSTVARPQNSE